MRISDWSSDVCSSYLAHADAACYMAKDHGRNRVHFYSAQDDETVRRRGEMEWANRLRWPIDEGRLLLDYQEVRPLQGRTADDPYIAVRLPPRAQEGRGEPAVAHRPGLGRPGLRVGQDA